MSLGIIDQFGRDRTAPRPQMGERARRDLHIIVEHGHALEAVLRRALAYERQERKFGGLPVVLRKMPEPQLKLKPGTRLMREWNGTMYSVLVTADGFDFGGKTWRSLSMIARHITGAHWSGPRFFGLKRAKRS
jgi:Protein of unknown function (DUF2924)